MWDTILRALSTGKGLKTRGPDAWPKADLKAPGMREGLAIMYGHIGDGAPWPTQIVRGHVTCLLLNSDRWCSMAYLIGSGLL